MTIKSFVIQSLKGFYERLPLKKIIFNGKYENPDNTGTVYLNSGFISGYGSHSAQLTGIDGEAIGSYSVSEGPLSIGYCSHSEGKTYKRTETVNISNGEFVLTWILVKLCYMMAIIILL